MIPATHGYDGDPSWAGHRLWVVLIVGAAAVLSPFFACVTPFAALATLAALKLGRREMFAVAGMAWLANQAAGYGVLGYPWTWDTAAWGLAILLAVALSAVAARSLAVRRPAPLAVSLPFVAAFTVFELGLYCAGSVVPSSQQAFAATVVWHVFLVNGASLYAAMALHAVTMWLIHGWRTVGSTNAVASTP